MAEILRNRSASENSSGEREFGRWEDAKLLAP